MEQRVPAIAAAFEQLGHAGFGALELFFHGASGLPVAAGRIGLRTGGRGGHDLGLAIAQEWVAEHLVVVLLQREEREDPGQQHNSGNHQEGRLIADGVTQLAERLRQDHIADLGRDLETDHVQGGRQGRIEVQGEVPEDRQDEQRNLERVQHLDCGDGDRVAQNCATEDAQGHDGHAHQQRVADADLAHDDRDDTHHRGLAEDLRGVEDAVDLLAAFLGFEQPGVEIGEHLLIEDRVEGPGEDDEDDDEPQRLHPEQAGHFPDAGLGGLHRAGFVVVGRAGLPEELDQQQGDAENRAHDEVQVRVGGEQEAGHQRDHRVTERAPHAGLAVFEVETAAHALGECFQQANTSHEAGRQDDRAQDHAEHELVLQQWLVDEDDERRNTGGDDADENGQVTLETQPILDGAVEEHQDERHERVHRIHGADLATIQPRAGVLGEPQLEEGPPDTPGHEEEKQRQGALQV
ncbi:hypothetical protein SDC9_114780 [bioreactor metagenome]|uniref:Uncharacterized protein n=1 Tax=bioreactor metagenome TaxID=1076179 RepID=A0A645BRA8_9ZZZZ